MLAILERGRVHAGYATLRLINDIDRDQYVDTSVALFEHGPDLGTLNLVPSAVRRPLVSSGKTPRTPLLKLRPREQTVAILNLSDWFELDTLPYVVQYAASHPLDGDGAQLVLVTSNKITLEI